MGEPRIGADHRPRRSDRGGDLREPALRDHPRARLEPRHLARHRLFVGGGEGEHRRQPPLGDEAGEPPPIRRRPALRGPGGAVQQHHARLALPGRPEPVVEPREIGRVAEHGAEQPPRPFDRVEIARHVMPARIEQAGERLAQARPIEPLDPHPRELGEHRALGEPLRVEHEIVAPIAQSRLQRRDLGPGGSGRDGLAPAPDRHRDHGLHARMQPRDVGEPLLDQPVDLEIGARGERLRHRRKGVDDIAHRRGLDQQHPHAVTRAAAASTASTPSPSRQASVPSGQIFSWQGEQASPSVTISDRADNGGVFAAEVEP